MNLPRMTLFFRCFFFLKLNLKIQGIYVLPNPTREHPQMFVGIILPRNISSQLEKEFVFALNQFSTIKESQVISNMSQEQKQRTSERIAKFLIDVGDKLAVGATSAATKTGKYMADKGEEYRANLVYFLTFVVVSGLEWVT